MRTSAGSIRALYIDAIEYPYDPVF